MEKHNTHFFYFLFFILLALLLIFTFNWFVDPYYVNNGPRIKRINWFKPGADQDIESFKLIQLSHQNINTVLLGSSRVGDGINPKDLRYKYDMPAYNFALNASTSSRMKHYIEFLIRTQPNLKNIILGLDIYTFINPQIGNNKSAKEILENNNFKLLKRVWSYFSLRTFVKSKKTVFKNYFEKIKSSYERNGFKFRLNDTKDRFSKWMASELGAKWLQYAVNRKGVDIDLLELRKLKEIQELCKKNKINLVTFLTPSHASFIEAYHIAKYSNLIPDIIRKIVNIGPLWSFYGYNTITTEKISDGNYFYDFSHFNPTTGQFIINRMSSYKEDEIPHDFGIWLTAENVNFELDKMYEKRNKWIRKNKKIVNLLNNFVL